MPARADVTPEESSTSLGEVAVLPAAGTGEATVFEAHTGEDGSPSSARVEQIEARRLVPDDTAPAAFEDFKITGPDSQLLAGFGSRGVAWVSRPNADAPPAIEWRLAPPGDQPGISAVSAIRFGPSRRPRQVLWADNDTREIAIYDTRLESRLWTHRLVSPPTRSEVVQTIALPEHRVAYAANWTSAGLSAIDVLDLTSATPSKPVYRFTDTDTVDVPASTQTVVDERIDDVRDLFGRRDGSLLVTTPRHLLVLSLEEQRVTASFALADHTDLMGGAFISARQLPSGHVAVATVEPGLWTRSHPNHRLYWLAEDLSSILARSPQLERAPWQLEAAAGHGATGTLGFEPGEAFLPTADAEAAELSGRAFEIYPVPLRPGTDGRLDATLLQNGRHPVVLSRLQLVARDGTCRDDPTGEPRVLVDRRDRVLRPNRALDVRAGFDVPSAVERGTWCLELRGRTSSSSAWHVFGSPRSVEIVAAGADAGSGGRRIEPIDLGVRYHGDDVGTDARAEPAPPDVSASPSSPPPKEGCGCRTRPSSPGGLQGLLVLFGVVAGMCRRRRRLYA